ncbi:DUF3375 domain-containing protein [Scrofimicrobium canadense]|uniref:DUF3375 domain-containing protein n=1 Tax=Scrofimicrobium canadense TaxID=2652290 RepID=UPI00197F9EFB|nr:DUF3375 domain-containing protein [Scrofimicrobium canadense]
MALDPYGDVQALAHLRETSPAWKLLRVPNAPLVLGFLGDFFIERHQGATPESTLVGALDEYLYAVHLVDEDLYTAGAQTYLDGWSEPDQGWLRKFYPSGSDEVHFDATSAVEKAYRWIEGIKTRAFIGTESRLHTLVGLLREMVHGAEEDPSIRMQDLQAQRQRIDEEIAKVEAGIMGRLEATNLRERYQLFMATSRDLMADFRAVEENFRDLDRATREMIAAWDGSKGELLADLVQSRSSIANSDEGRSFQSFHDFLLSSDRQEELSNLLAALTSIEDIDVARGVRTIHHDWAEGAERTQQTVRNLSEQLRSFLEDRVWLENRRVLELIRSIEKRALALREDPEAKPRAGMTIDVPGVQISLPMARPLHTMRHDVSVDSLVEPAVSEDIDLDSLLSQRFVDTVRLANNIRTCLPPRSSAFLPEILDLFPVEEGVAELLGYLTIDAPDIEIVVNHEKRILIECNGPDGMRRMRMPEVKVVRK